MFMFFTKKTSAKLIKPTHDNWTRVRIWKPTWQPVNMQDPSIRQPKPSSFFASVIGGHVGHVSIQTSAFYASAYPASQNRSAISSGKPVSLGLTEHPKQDIKALLTPHLTFDYFCLNTESMRKKFITISENEIQYRTFRLFPKRGFNCSDLAFTILETGGIRQLFGYKEKCQLIPGSFCFYTPNIIANVLESAKRRELELFPESKNMSIVNENFNQFKK